MNKSELRQSMRHQRRALSLRQRQTSAQKLAANLKRNPRFMAAKYIALYLSHDGEIDPHLLTNELLSYGKQIFLPVLHPLKNGHLSFIRYTHNTRMKANRYGIAEPDFRDGRRMAARYLSVICLPLVAFDQQGNRLGMGGGYYDRTLAFMNQGGHQPSLIGCAYDFQKLPQLPVEDWDIELMAIATDHAFYRC